MVAAEEVDAVVARLSWRDLSWLARVGVDMETGLEVAGVLKFEDWSLIVDGGAAAASEERAWDRGDTGRESGRRSALDFGEDCGVTREPLEEVSTQTRMQKHTRHDCRLQLLRLRAGTTGIGAAGLMYAK